jgi:hypothetical protein
MAIELIAMLCLNPLKGPRTIVEETVETLVHCIAVVNEATICTWRRDVQIMTLAGPSSCEARVFVVRLDALSTSS